MGFQTTDVAALLPVLEAFLADDDKVEKLFDEIDTATPQLQDPSVAPFVLNRDLFDNTMVPDESRCAPGVNGVSVAGFFVTQCPPMDNSRINPIPFMGLFQSINFVISFEPVDLSRLYGTPGAKEDTGDYTMQRFTFLEHAYTQFCVKCPDHGVPANPKALVDILDIVDGQPTLSHCLAGVGRSFIPILYRMMMLKIENGEPLDFGEIMREMRERRPGALQTHEQFSFAIKMVTEKLSRSISVEKSNPDAKRKGSEKEKGEDKKSKPDVAEHDHPSSP